MPEPAAARPTIEPSKGGRPEKPISADVLKGLGLIGCTLEEAAAALGVGKSTLKDRLNAASPTYDQVLFDAWEDGKANCRIRLRRLQWAGAAKGNPAMLIWLGKQLLGQREYVSMRVGGDSENPEPIKTQGGADDLSSIADLIQPFVPTRDPAEDEGGDDPVVEKPARAGRKKRT